MGELKSIDHGGRRERLTFIPEEGSSHPMNIEQFAIGIGQQMSISVPGCSAEAPHPRALLMMMKGSPH